jgi:hypothetical protein
MPVPSNASLVQALKHAKQFIYVLHIKAYSVVPDEYYQVIFPSAQPISISACERVRVNLIALEIRLTTQTVPSRTRSQNLGGRISSHGQRSIVVHFLYDGSTPVLYV